MSVELSAQTIARLNLLFTEKEKPKAIAMLRDDCADDLPLWNNVTPEGLERIRYAVLKLSGGDLAVLATAVQEANIDWRDVLVMAGFGHDPEIHLTWWPEK